MILSTCLFMLSLTTLGPVTDDRVEYRTIVLKPVGNQWEMRYDQRVAMKTRPGLRMGRFAIPVSPRRQMKDFSGSLTVGKRVDPAGKPKPYKQGTGDIDDFKFWSVIVPGLKPKSRLEYGYTYVMDDPAWMPAIHFGGDFPIDQITVELHLPPRYALNHGFINPDGIPIQYQTVQEGDITIHRFSAQNLPARAVGKRNAVLFPGVHGAGLEPWTALGDRIQQMYAQIPTGDLSEATQKLAEHTDRECYLNAAYELVRDDIRYEAVSLGDHDYKAASPATVLASRYGDCKDKAWLLHQLLAERDIPSHLVLVASSARLLPEPDVAAVNRFDHVILAVPKVSGGFRFMDPTSSEPLDQLPRADRGAAALIIQKGNHQRVQLPDEGEPDTWDIQATLDDGDQIRWRIHYSSPDFSFRDIINSRPESSRQRMARSVAASLLSERLHNRLQDMTITPIENGLILEISEPATRIGKQLILPESPLPAPTPPLGTAPYDNHQRIRRTQTVTWTLPTGLTRPQTAPVNLSGDGFRVQMETQANRTTRQINITARILNLNTDQTQQLREACAERFWSPRQGGA